MDGRRRGPGDSPGWARLVGDASTMDGGAGIVYDLFGGPSSSFGLSSTRKNGAGGQTPAVLRTDAAASPGGSAAASSEEVRYQWTPPPVDMVMLMVNDHDADIVLCSDDSTEGGRLELFVVRSSDDVELFIRC